MVLQTYFGHLIRVLHWCTDQSMTDALEKLELTASQGPIMAFLIHRKEPACPRDVEEAFRLSHPTVSGILSRLEQKGFVALRPDPRDRRFKRIQVLPKGMACHDVMQSTIVQNEERMLQDFTPEERAQFRQLLQRAIVNMGSSPCHHKSKEE